MLSKMASTCIERQTRNCIFRIDEIGHFHFQVYTKRAEPRLELIFLRGYCTSSEGGVHGEGITCFTNWRGIDIMESTTTVSET